MSPSEFENLLSQVEKSCQAVGDAVSHGGPEDVACASGKLQGLAVSISQLLSAYPAEAIAAQKCRTRLKQMSDSLSLQREQLIRRAAVNERALNTMVPATQESSYALAAGLYGGTARQSGAFKLLTA